MPKTIINKLETIKIDLTLIEKLRELELEISSIVKSKEIKKTAEDFIKILEEENSKELKYKALFALVTYYRYAQEPDNLHINFKKYRVQFEDNNFPTFQHLVFLVELDALQFTTFNKTKSINFLDKVEKFIYEVKEEHSMKDLGFLSGTMHLYAHTFATIYELDNSLKETLKNKFDFAIECVDFAIRDDKKYAKFYSTKARLNIFDEDFDEATINISKAITKENVNAEQYNSRLTEYTFVKNMIVLKKGQYETEKLSLKLSKQLELQTNELNKQKEELQAKMELVDEKISESTTKNIEIIGFFTGIISFVIATIQITIEVNFKEAVVMILMLLGVWIVSFSCFSALLKKLDKDNLKKLISIILLGLLIILGGLIYGFLVFK